MFCRIKLKLNIICKKQSLFSKHHNYVFFKVLCYLRLGFPSILILHVYQKRQRILQIFPRHPPIHYSAPHILLPLLVPGIVVNSHSHSHLGIKIIKQILISSWFLFAYINKIDTNMTGEIIAESLLYILIVYWPVNRCSDCKQCSE